MDIRSRAGSLRPIRHFLNHRPHDHDPSSPESRSRSAADGDPDGQRAPQRRPDAARAEPTAGGRPIAIVGVGCRFPDADDPAALLDLVLTGRRAFRRLPPSRLELADYYSADRATPDATYSARAALLEGWRFDLTAFGVPAPAYRAVDPAHWLALETAARALAAAGFADGQGLARSRTGVIIGNTLTGDVSRAAALRLRWPYVRRVLAESLAAGGIPRERAMPVLRHAAQRYLAPFPATTDETLTGSTPAAIASRICGYFGFRGGGFAVDGSHASSLLAVASACTSLAAGDLDVALAGGVDLSLDPLELVGLAKTGVLARGDVRVYDASPTGFLPGEGCGIVVLMRSADARRAGLPAYAEIVGWGSSAAGQASIAMPDARSQLLALHRAYERAGIAPGDVQLIEGHGAGTAAADATELSALAELRSGARQAAALGSIKANIGNAKAAAGAAGLIKTVLAMSSGVIPPTTGVTHPHPLLRGDQAALRLPGTPEPWPDGTRIAAVNGMGPGINVHVVLRGEPSRGRHVRRPRTATPAPRAAAGPAVAAAAGAPGTAAQAAPVIVCPGRPTAYLLHAPDRGAMDALLARVARVAPWLSDAELGDLACQFARDAARQGPVRVALVASKQDHLAKLAGQAAALLPGLTGGGLVLRPGIVAGHGAAGRVTLLISEPGAGGAPFRPLSALRWLDLLGVQATAAVGFGTSEPAGLVWAGLLSEAQAASLMDGRAEIRNATATRDATTGPAARRTAADERADRIREAVRRLTPAEPRRRLISSVLGREIASGQDVADLLCADLDRPSGLGHALGAGAADASLLLETGPGQVLIEAASVLCDVPGVSLGAGGAPDAARAAAALFAAGALPNPAAFFAGAPWRPIDIWRDHSFITSPCQATPPAATPRSGTARSDAPASTDASPPAPLAAAAAAAQRAVAAGRAAATPRAVPPQSVAAPRAVPARAVPSPAVADAQGAAAGPAAAGIDPWVRCFAEEFRPMPADAIPVGDDRPWRVRAATRKALGPLVQELFRDDPEADRALAIVPDATNPDSCAVALAAARDAIDSGQLVMITDGPGFTGFCACLHAEHPELGITVIRTPGSADGLRAARRFAAARPGRFSELVIDGSARPHQAIMAPAQTPGSGEFPLGPGDVALVSRASGAAVLALAQVLACCGSAVALIGRAGPGETGEVEAGLERLRRAGARVTVDDVDLANPADVRFALQRIEERLGPVTAVAHAAGPGRCSPLAKLTEDEVRSHVAAETAKLDDLVSGILSRQIRQIITFGSVVGRYGLAGEGLLALVSSALAERAERMADGIPGCRAVHVDWPAWSGSGLGQRASLVDGLARSGATAIGVQDGSRLLLKILATPGLRGRLAVHGRAGIPAPGAIAAAAHPATDLGGRFLENVRVHYPGIELVCEARLTLQTDPYLADHRVDGMPVLPATMALEAMAEAAAVLAGRPLRHLTDVSMDAPVVIPAGTGGAQALIRVCALAEGPDVTAVLRCEDSGFATDHVRATFRGADDAAAGAPPSRAAGLPELDEMPASHAGIIDGTELYGPICFQSGRFRRAALMPEVTSRSCRALVRGGDAQPWFGDRDGAGDAGLILGSPGLNDATWHVLQACVPHRRMLPAGCEGVTFSGRVADGAVEIRAVETRVLPQAGGPAAARPAPQAEYVWDVEAVDAADQQLVTWRGLRLRDAGPLPRNAAWPPSLLSVYLERSAMALGLDPELRVTVGYAQPGGAGPAAPASTVVPRPSPAPDRHPPVRGSARLEGLALSVRAPGAACGWAAVVPVPTARPGRPAGHPAPAAVTPGRAAGQPVRAAAKPSPAAAEPSPAGGRLSPAGGLAEIEDRVRDVLHEAPAVVSARLRAIAACLAQAGSPAVSAVSAVSAGRAADGDWLVLSAGQGTLACTVVEISGVSCPVAIAVLTPGTGRGRERDGAAPSRPRRHSAARS